MMALVTENQLDEWVRSNARDAQELIVELVWRLVAASCPKPQERRFPLGDSIGQHGPDGILDVDLAFEPFVPDGRSLWEIGTGANAGDKATSDYKSLTESIPRSVRSESTFVFVTPLSGRRDWEHTWKENAQAAWLENRHGKHEWKDVRIIDGTKLIDWIHQFPAVELWLAQNICGLQEQQIEIPEQRWALVRSVGESPPLTPNVFLANRNEACEKLQKVLNGTAVQLKVATHFPDQAIDFVCAYLASLEDESRIDAAGRCLIVSGTDAWNTVCDQWRNLILIADAALDLSNHAGIKFIQKAREAGHAVIFGGPHGGLPDPASVPLPMPSSHQVRQALEEAGYTEQRARTLAARSGGNLGSLLRLLQNLSVLPAWAEHSDATDLAIAAVLGSWTDSSEADRAVIEGLAGRTYEEWIGKMREIALDPGIPLIQHEGNWKFIARYEGRYALGARLFDEHLDRLHDAAVSVLRENDPQFELPPEERYAASIHGKILAHSQPLRRGLAESLALLGNHPNALTSCTHGKTESTVILAVRGILSDADWMRWGSLNDLVPLLAEAAPGEFLDTVERALCSDPCPFDELFAQESGGALGRTYMSGLLWALETLAWDADHLIRVVVILGELAAHDPGGQWKNRPANSLTTILLPWFPQTCAPIAKRVAATKALLDELPDIGWELLLSLLPRSHGASSETHRPAWRATIPDDWKQGVTNYDYFKQVSAYSELAIIEARNDVSKLAELVGHLENLPRPAHDQFLEYLASDAVMGLSEADRLQVWNEIDDLVRKHRKFADAERVITSEQVEKIASIAERLAPTAPFLRHQRLFIEHDFGLYEERGNYEEQTRDLEDRRQRAIEEVAAEGGVQSVLEFAKQVSSPRRVGIAFGPVAGTDVDATALPALLESDENSLSQFAEGFVWGLFRGLGWQWVDCVDMSKWTPAQIGQFLSFLPFTQDTWQRSKRLLGQDESAYWTKTTADVFQAEGELGFAADQLLRYERPDAAIYCLAKMVHDKQTLDSGMAVRALLQAVQSSQNLRANDVHDIVDIIKALQDDPDTSTEDLLRVEWAYLLVLDGYHDASPKALERGLADDPAFFCEVIRLAFRSKKEERPTEELTEERERIAANAYRLLREWRTPPGHQEDGTYDGDALTSWLEAVKRECADTGHLESAMKIVGHVLIRVPPDPDGLWIHRSAAAVLNAKDAKGMRDGFRATLYSSRGTHWIDPTGKPERELAAKYRAQAEAVEEAGYHRLGIALRKLADTYKREAERVSSEEFFDD